MILKNRLFEKTEPDRDATLFIIYCEGTKREPKYFSYFNEISSRIKLEIIHAGSQGNNSPSGLLSQAQKDFGDSKNTTAKYSIDSDDQVWFVVDTDQWGPHID